MRKPSILIVDDEEAARYSARRVLGEDAYELSETDGASACMEALDEVQPDVVLLDYVMDDVDGLEVLEQMQEKKNPPVVIMMTAQGSEEVAVEALKTGAFDYIVKPYESEELRASVEKAMEKRRLEQENRQLRQEVTEAREHEIIGKSEEIQDVREQIRQVAPTTASVVITGESGTGKELVAREIHRQSEREGRLRTVNCAAIAENLIESELFGHEKGAFTGADSRHRGKFEQADGGTLFLDEIGEMTPDVQKKFLRVLEEEVFERVGGEEKIEVDVRIVCATHRDLEKLVEEGSFREDLYYRINVVEIELPPLRARGEDVLLLARHFLDKFSEEHNRPAEHLSDEAREWLMSYGWPGNVRELRNVMERAVIVSGDETIDTDDLPADLDGTDQPYEASFDTSGDFQDTKQRVVHRFEKTFITEALERNGGNVSQTAEEIGMYRQNLQKKINRHDIDVDRIREESD